MLALLRTLILALLATSSVALASPGLALANDWPHFRGPFYNGSTDEKDLPASFSRTENIAWEAKLPGPSAATPIVWGDHVFISSSDPDSNELKALAFDRRSGDLRWAHTIAKKIQRDSRSNFASPSPVTDGKIVVFFYGNGDLLAYDFDGKELWKRNVQDEYGEFAFLWTFSSSPLLWKDKLYLQVLQRDTAVDGRGFRDKVNESYLLALDPRSGEKIFQETRSSKAVAESREAFTSPIPFSGEGGPAILIAGGDALTAHSPDNGRELWRWGTWNPERIGHWRLVPSPVASDDTVLVCGPKSAPIYAIEAGKSGELGEDAIAWVSNTDRREVTSDVPTPAFYDGDFFVLSDVRKRLSRIEPASGEVKWVVELPGFPKYEASPLAADGKIYTINFEGQVAIFDAKDGKLLQTIPLEANGEYAIRSSIVAAQGQLFIRLNRRLICVGKK